MMVLTLSVLFVLAFNGGCDIPGEISAPDACIQTIVIEGDFNGTLTQEGCPEGEVKAVPPCWTSTQSRNRLPESECKACLAETRECAWTSDFFEGTPTQYILNGEPLI